MRQPYFAVVLAWLIWTVAGTPRARAAADAPLVLVRDGAPACRIVIGSDAPTPAYSALPGGKLLQAYLEKISGASVPLVAEDAPGATADDGAALVLVGDGPLVRSLGLTRDGLHPEGFIIRTVGNKLVILGGDERTLKGSYNGAVALLERSLGVRWLMPFETGEVVPKRRTVAIGPIDVADRPKFAARNVRNQYSSGSLWDISKKWMGDEARHLKLAQEAAEWFARQRLEYGVQLNGSHSNEAWWELYGRAHPEYFAQQPDGTRFVPERNAAYAKLCVSSEAVIGRIVGDALALLDKNPALQSVPVSPNDGGGWGYCMCEQCKSWDDPRGRTFTFLPTRDEPEFQYVAVSDRYARHYSEVARRVAEKHPDVLVVGMAYGHYTPAPLRTKVHPNVVILYVGNDVYLDDKEREVVRADVVGWGRAGAQLGWRPNWIRQDGWPLTYPHKMAEDLRDFYRAGMRYADFDTCVNDWGAGGINYYVLARLLWNPEQDVDAIIDDYCRAGFGPAAPAMKRYFARMEAITARLAATADGQPWYYQAIRAYTPEALGGALGDLKDADGLAAAAGEEAGRIRGRIDLFRQAIEWTAIHVDMAAAVRRLREGADNRAECDALVARRERWYQDHLYTEAMPVPYIRWQNERFKVFFEP